MFSIAKKKDFQGKGLHVFLEISHLGEKRNLLKRKIIITLRSLLKIV